MQSKDVGDEDYEGFELKSLFYLIKNKLSKDQTVDINEKIEKCLSFFILYTGKVEIAIPEKEPIMHYFPIRPSGTFLRGFLRDQYIESVPCVPSTLRMKDLLIDTGPTLTAKMQAGHSIHTKINYPGLSEIFRWSRLWLALLVILSIVLNYLISLSYSDVDSRDILIGYGGERKFPYNFFSN